MPVFVPVSLKSVLMGVMAHVIRAAPKDPLRARVSCTVVGKSDGSSTLTWKWKFVKRIKSKTIIINIKDIGYKRHFYDSQNVVPEGFQEQS